MFSRFAFHLDIRPTAAPLRCRMMLAVVAFTAAVTAPPALAQTTTNKLRSGQQYAGQQVLIPGSRPAATKTAKPQTQKPALVRQAAAAAPAQPAPAQPAATARKSQPQKPQARPASLVRRAAHGEVIDEMPPSHIPSSEVAQAGHFVHGEVVCGAEPTCGFPGGCDDPYCTEPTCGIEAGCGFEPSMPFEASCGLEPGCGGYGCDVGACNDCVGIHLPILRVDWRRFDFFAGVNSFTGPANHATDGAPLRGGSGSFGFYQGFNEGRSLNRLFGLDLSAQFGLRATQSSLSGAEFTEDSRNQIFLTGGLFRRVDFGLQYGFVVDYLYDDWWYRNNLVQMRGEISWNDNCGREFGYQFMGSSDDSTSRTTLIGAGGVITTGTASFEPTNQHRLFLRGNTARGATYMAFAGGTDQGDGLLGGLLTSNFRNRFAVQGGVTYLIPNESNRAGGFENESWNLSMGIVFRPGGKNGAGRYCRPMFDVADNGTFLVDRKD